MSPFPVFHADASFPERLPLSSNLSISRCIRISWRFHLTFVRVRICFECRQQSMKTHIWKVPILAGWTLRSSFADIINRRSACISHRIIANPRHFLIVFLMVIKFNGRTSNKSQSILYHQRESIVSFSENTHRTEQFDFGKYLSLLFWIHIECHVQQ